MDLTIQDYLNFVGDLLGQAEEADGLGSRRFYFASKTVLADEAEELRNVNRIRV
jgi:hypothetical protein